LVRATLVDQIRAFVSEIAAFKQEAAAGHFTRKPSNRNATKAFNPEFHGKKKGRRSGTLDYESFQAWL